MKLFDLINPRKLVAQFTFSFGGGGDAGGSTPDTRYANLDKLYGIQSQASQFMLDNALPIVPQVTQNSVAMNDEAQTGLLGERARNMAGADASQAFGQDLAAVNRNTARFGAEFNPNRMTALGNNAAVAGATNKVNAMNKASQWGEDQKWNRNANLYGQVMGMNNGAMNGLSSAGAGLNSMNAQQNQMDAANAKGYGQAGAAFSSALFKADGGYIKAPKMAAGGDAWAAYKAANPISIGSYSGRRRGTSPIKGMLAGAAPQALGAGLKDLLGKNSQIISLGKDGVSAVKNAGQFLNGAESIGQAQEFSDAAQASLDAGYTGAEALGMVAQGADYADSAVAAADAAEMADAATAASTASDAGSAASAFSDASALWAADGGYIKKPGLKLALGGLAKSSIASSDKLDSDTLAAMDSSSSLQLAKMDDAGKAGGKNQLETHAKPVGGTPEDPDGFGKYGGDNRHTGGTSVIKYFGNTIFPGLGTALGDVVADAIHPAAEAATRTAIVTGDDAAGVAGAQMMDPVGASLSGKYSSEELVKGSVLNGLGLTWAGKFLADGGQIRKNMKPGGKVSGPGSATSDDIPAWLSDGEYVLNAKAVDLVGKNRLDQINKAGLALRKGRADPAIIKKQAGLALGGAVKRKGC
jgi:hypothetical protein